MTDKKNDNDNDTEWMEFDPNDSRVIEQKPKSTKNLHRIIKDTNQEDSCLVITAIFLFVFIVIVLIATQ